MSVLSESTHGGVSRMLRGAAARVKLRSVRLVGLEMFGMPIIAFIALTCSGVKVFSALIWLGVMAGIFMLKLAGYRKGRGINDLSTKTWSDMCASHVRETLTFFISLLTVHVVLEVVHHRQTVQDVVNSISEERNQIEVGLVIRLISDEGNQRWR